MRGRAATPEAEAARREKIRRAVSRRVQYRDSRGRFVSRAQFTRETGRIGVSAPRTGGWIRVLIVSDYRKHSPRYPQKLGVDYENGHEYTTYIDPRIATNPSALQAHLNRRYPNRVHYRARVVEYL
jgi:hypothetical protein